MKSSKKIAFLFPGQGAQYVGMGKSFYEAFAIFRQTIEEGCDLLSFDLKKVIFEGPESDLTTTKYSQPAIFLISIATLKVIQEQFPSIIPSVCAGLSLGEYTALVASKKLNFQDALLLVQKRAIWMSEACEKSPGSMSAVIGLEPEVVKEVIAALNPPHKIWAANFNCPGQIVISGTKEGLAIATEKLKQKGARKLLPLKVGGAFHSGLMQYAQDKLTEVISAIQIMKSDIDIVMNTPGDFVKEEKEIKSFLVKQVTHSVYWQKSIEAMEKEMVQTFIEIGPGKSLTNMNKKIPIKGSSYFVDKAQDLDNLAEIQ